MTRFTEFLKGVQTEFSEALTPSSHTTISSLLEKNVFKNTGIDPKVAIQQYRRNVLENTVSALAQAYPLTLATIGDEKFRTLAGLYFQRHCIDDGVVESAEFGYGKHFQKAVAAATAGDARLGEIAALDWLMHEVFYELETPTLTFQAAATFMQGATAARIALVASVRLMSCRWRVEGVVRKVLELDVKADESLAEPLIVWKKQHEVMLGRVEGEIAGLVDFFGVGRSYQEIIERCFCSEAEAQLFSEFLAVGIERGWLGEAIP